MRTFIVRLEDVDRGADALAQAQRLGYTAGDRETAQLADGYRARGDTLARTARTLCGHRAGTGIPHARGRGVPAGARPLRESRSASPTCRATCARSSGRSIRSSSGCTTSSQSPSQPVSPLTETPSGRCDRRRSVDVQPDRAMGRDLHDRGRRRDRQRTQQRARQRFQPGRAVAGRHVLRGAAGHHAGLCRPHQRLRAVGERARRRPARQPEYASSIPDGSSRRWRTVFANANDRRFAAQELFAVPGRRAEPGRALPNVGAIARATVAAATIDAIEEAGCVCATAAAKQRIGRGVAAVRRRKRCRS